MSRRYRDADVKLLWGLSAARCACPDCRAICVAERTAIDPTATLGIIAHIYAHSPGGPRSNPALTVADRDSYENLILLCDTCHTRVDRQPNTYTPELLRQWKADHEHWVRTQLTVEMPEVTFAELEVVAKAISGPASTGDIDFTLIDPREKMEKNELTDSVHFLLTFGLGKSGEVQRFLQDMAKLDPLFPERLKAGFVAEYDRLRSVEGLRGDTLFEALLAFAGRSSPDFKLQAAGLAVLAYLFQACEVFQS